MQTRSHPHPTQSYRRTSSRGISMTHRHTPHVEATRLDQRPERTIHTSLLKGLSKQFHRRSKRRSDATAGRARDLSVPSRAEASRTVLRKDRDLRRVETVTPISIESPRGQPATRNRTHQSLRTPSRSRRSLHNKS